MPKKLNRYEVRRKKLNMAGSLLINRKNHISKEANRRWGIEEIGYGPFLTPRA